MKPEHAFVIGKKPVDRILSIVHTIQSQYQSQLKEAQRAVAREEERAKKATTEWQMERQRLQQRITTLEQAPGTARTSATEESANSRELERKLEETLCLKAALAADFQRVLSELNALEQSNPTEEANPAPYGEIAKVVRSEVSRIQLLVDEIERKLADPAIELSTEIRLGRQRAELEAYLKGLRYSLGEVAPSLESL